MNNNIIITTSVSTEKVQDTLCSAIEGGSNYWYMIVKVDGRELAEFLHEIPFKGGALYISEYADGYGGKYAQEKPFKLDAVAIVKGVQAMAMNHPKQFADMVNDNGDADTGDVLLQCCVFGELIYG